MFETGVSVHIDYAENIFTALLTYIFINVGYNHFVIFFIFKAGMLDNSPLLDHISRNIIFTKNT